MSSSLSEEKINNTKQTLILGHAGKNHPDAITLDIDPEHHPDVVHNLDTFPYPFEDNRFKRIVCHHVLEHLSNLPPVMAELHRICAPDGELVIEVPHHSSWCANTPEHKLRFSYFAFDGYVIDGATTWINGQKFRLLDREVTFHRSHRRYGLHKLFNRFPMAYERFWTYLFPAEHFKTRLQPIKS